LETEASRAPLAALERVAAIALVGVGPIYVFQFFFVWLVRGAPLLPILLLGLAALALAGLTLAGFSWARRLACSWPWWDWRLGSPLIAPR
jgi:hypothetical protein